MDQIKTAVAQFLQNPQMQSIIQSTEVERKKIVRDGFILLAAGLVPVLLLAYLFWIPEHKLSLENIEGLGKLAVVIFVLAMFYIQRKAKKSNTLHNDVISVLAREIDSGLSYTYTVSERPNWIANRAIIPDYDDIVITDNIRHVSQNQHHGLTFKITSSGYKIVAGKGSGKSRTIVMKAFVTEIAFENPRHFATEQILIKGETPGFFSDLFSHRHAVHLESNEFEKHFDVSCANQTLAREILNPYMMHVLMEFTAKQRKQFRYDFLFTENKLYVTRHAKAYAPNSAQFGGFSPFVPYTSPKIYEDFYQEFIHFQKLIADLEVYYYDYGTLEKQSTLQ